MHDASLVFFTGTAIVLCLLPLPMQWRARNTGTLLNIAWNLIGNTIWFLNAVLWWNRNDDRAPVFCDFSVKLQTAIAPGLTAASLCMNRRLATIAMSRAVSATPRRRRLDLGIDLTLGVGLPIVLMALSYVVQGHRYDIFEGFGCELPVYISTPSIFIINVTPIALGIVSAVYGAIAVSFFLSRRLQFSALLKSSQSGLDTNQYIRLVSLASLDVFLSLPLSIFFLAFAAPVAAQRPWPGFDFVHYNWQQINMYGISADSATGIIVRMLTRWLCPTLAIVFFIFFGVSRDAVAEYLRYARWLQTYLPIRRNKHNSTQALFIPKLGSAVVGPSDPEWRLKRESADGGDPGPGLAMRSAGHPLGGNGVAIKVEREIV